MRACVLPTRHMVRPCVPVCFQPVILAPSAPSRAAPFLAPAGAPSGNAGGASSISTIAIANGSSRGAPPSPPSPPQPAAPSGWAGCTNLSYVNVESNGLSGGVPGAAPSWVQGGSAGQCSRLATQGPLAAPPGLLPLTLTPSPSPAHGPRFGLALTTLSLSLSQPFRFGLALTTLSHPPLTSLALLPPTTRPAALAAATVPVGQRAVGAAAALGPARQPHCGRPVGQRAVGAAAARHAGHCALPGLCGQRLHRWAAARTSLILKSPISARLRHCVQFGTRLC
jgi:hypothetical protein